MVFEHIEKLKSEYTDKYVIVDDARPELRRFKDMTGVVKTVNMSGRALVEFDAHANIGWFDIDLDFLKVVDAPLEKPEKVAAPTKKAAPAKKPAAKAEKPAGGGAGMSVADILAAAKAGGSAKAPVAKAPAAEKVAPKPSAEKNKVAAGGAGMSVADILAAARGGAAAPVAKPAAAKPAAKPEPAPEPEEAAAPEPVAEEPAAPVGDLPTDVDGILAFCRQRDA